MAEKLSLKGTYYEIGHSFGHHKSSEIRAYVAHLKNSSFYAKFEDFLLTKDGATLYQQFKATTDNCCSNYVTELRGVTDGAGVSYDDLFTLNVKPDLATAMEVTPGGSHGVQYTSMIDGCTNVLLQTDNKQVYLVHTEDIDPFVRDTGVMLSVEIHDDDGKLLEKWTEYVVPGLVPGAKFGFNSHGIMFGHNSISQKGLNKHGIPRKFMCRKLMTVDSIEEVTTILNQDPGIATAYCFTFLMSSESNACTRGTKTYVVEAVGTEEGTVLKQFLPTGIYHHCNTFQHLPHECHPTESSIHRAAVISQYVNRGQIRTKHDLLKVVSDDNDPKFPVYRTGKDPDHIANGATGMFDPQEGTLSVYTGKPSSTPPIHVFHVSR